MCLSSTPYGAGLHSLLPPDPVLHLLTCLAFLEVLWIAAEKKIKKNPPTNQTQPSFLFPPFSFPLKPCHSLQPCPYPCPSTAAWGSCHTVASRYLWNDAPVRKRAGQLGFGHFLPKIKFVIQEIRIILVLRHISVPWGSQGVIQRGDALLPWKSS